MLNSTQPPVTEEAIRELQKQQLERGDVKMVNICDQALRGDSWALDECRKALAGR